jgi:hypothetical protein
MKTGWYILRLNQIGNIGSHQIARIKEQPEEGFLTYENAEHRLIQLIENKGTHYFNWDAFTILQLFTVEPRKEQK